MYRLFIFKNALTVRFELASPIWVTAATTVIVNFLLTNVIRRHVRGMAGPNCEFLDYGAHLNLYHENSNILSGGRQSFGWGKGLYGNKMIHQPLDRVSAFKRWETWRWLSSSSSDIEAIIHFCSDLILVRIECGTRSQVIFGALRGTNHFIQHF